MSPLPLATDGSARFLPWLIALMVFLAATALASAFAIGSGIDRYNSALQGTLTIELPLPPSGMLEPAIVAQVLGTVSATPGVQSAAVLDPGATARLLRPWLGDIDPAALPLPVLIDVHLIHGSEIDRPALRARLRMLVPEASVEQRGAWLDQLLRLARLVQIAGAAIVLLVGLVAVTAVVFTTRTGLALHAALIDLLHVMGAGDDYVARQFQRHAFRLGLTGGLIGLVLTFLVFGAARLILEHGQAPMDALTGFSVPLVAWVPILLLPVTMGVVALVTARVTVLGILARMP